MTHHRDRHPRDRARPGHGRAGTDSGDRTAQERALRRLIRAEAAFDRGVEKAAGLRVRLERAEEKLVRRAGRVETAREALLTATDIAGMPALKVFPPAPPSSDPAGRAPGTGDDGEIGPTS